MIFDKEDDKQSETEKINDVDEENITKVTRNIIVKG